MEFLGREENWVQLVCRDLRVSLVHLVQMGQRYFTEAVTVKVEQFKPLPDK